MVIEIAIFQLCIIPIALLALADYKYKSIRDYHYRAVLIFFSVLTLLDLLLNFNILYIFKLILALVILAFALRYIKKILYSADIYLITFLIIASPISIIAIAISFLLITIGIGMKRLDRMYPYLPFLLISMLLLNLGISLI